MTTNHVINGAAVEEIVLGVVTRRNRKDGDASSSQSASFGDRRQSRIKRTRHTVVVPAGCPVRQAGSRLNTTILGEQKPWMGDLRVLVYVSLKKRLKRKCRQGRRWGSCAIQSDLQGVAHSGSPRIGAECVATTAYSRGIYLREDDVKRFHCLF